MTRNILELPNPDGQDSLVYTTISLERAPDTGGAPGVFAVIASVAIDTSDERTHYVDPAGALTSWYRHRYFDGTIYSDYSYPIQYGDYSARQWAIKDIPDADITLDRWDMWRDQVIQEMSAAGLGRPAAIQTLTPTGPTNEWFLLNSEIRRVTKVERYYSSGEFMAEFRNYQQRGRQIRIKRPITNATYKVYGVAELRALEDLDDQLYVVLKWGMRMYYLDWRRLQRMDMRPSLSRTRLTDTTSIPDFNGLYKEARAIYDKMLENSKMPTAAGYGSH